MKPINLKIRGLNSYIEEQDIDFKRLTEKGLFGIFGPTGSGKSTILDAITIALYGKISRDTNEYINTECENMYVEYEFEILTAEGRRTFTAKRSLKKDIKNNKKGYKTISAQFIEDTEDGIKIIAEGSNDVKGAVEKLLGLTADDFTRSVMLPQGKFSEFLKLTGRERRDMLERIFRLESYGKDLMDKIKKARYHNLKKLDILSGQMKCHENVSGEILKKNEEDYSKLVSEENKFKKEKTELDERYEKYKTVWELQEELSTYINEEKNFETEYKNISDEKSKLESSKRAWNVKPFIDENNETKIKIEKNTQDLNVLSADLLKIEQRLELENVEYDKALKAKNEILPALIVKEANISQSLDMKQNLNEVEKERKNLAVLYKENMDAKLKIESRIKVKSSEREDLCKQVSDIEGEMLKIKVESEYRDKIQKSLIFAENMTKIEENIKAKKAQIHDLNAELEKISPIFREKDSSINIIEEKYKNFKKNCPGNTSIIIKKQEELNKISNDLNMALEKQAEKKDADDKLKIILKRKDDLDQKLRMIEAYIESLKSKIKDVQGKMDDIKRHNAAFTLALNLKEGEPCPVCGSTHHPDIGVKTKILDDSAQKKIKDELEAELSKKEKDAKDIGTRFIKVSDGAKNLEDLQSKLKSYLNNVDIKLMGDSKLKVEGEINELVHMEEKLSSLRDERNDIEKLKIKYDESLKRELQELNELESEKEQIKMKFMPSDNICDVSKLKLEMDRILKNAEITLNYKKKQKILQDKILNFDEMLKEYDLKIKSLDIEIAKITESGKEKQSYIKNWKSQIDKLSEGKDPEQYIKEVKKSIEDIKTREEELKSKLECDLKVKKDMENKKLGKEQNGETLAKIYDAKNDKIFKLLGENHFEKIDDVLHAFMERDSMDELESKINSFEDNYKNIKNNIGRVKSKLKGEKIEIDAWQKIKDGRVQTSFKLDETIKEIAKMSQIIADMKRDLDEVKKLTDEKKELEHKKSILDDIETLVSGNKFVEFVASSELKYIALEASKRLKEITRGRYALELDPNFNFTMRDDYNGGTVRASNTLSGGETFLTSLALALALSSQIQLKGSVPLEFFFLDEGFGTLDSELLETVMESLERLRSDKLSIGIISHVDELKDRVPVKLMVKPPVPGISGSRVKIEYT